MWRAGRARCCALQKGGFAHRLLRLGLHRRARGPEREREPGGAEGRRAGLAAGAARPRCSSASTAEVGKEVYEKQDQDIMLPGRVIALTPALGPDVAKHVAGYAGVSSLELRRLFPAA